MGTSLSFNIFRTGFGHDLRSPLAATGFIFCISLFLSGCMSHQGGSEILKPLPLRSHVRPTPPEKMAWIAPGTFLMGTNEVDEKNEGMALGFPQAWYEDERPLSKPRLKGYYIDLFEVTQHDYLKFIRTTGHRPPAHWRNGVYKVGSGNHPVSFVDWYDANDYCRWLGKRLPSEQEWEKAARGSDGNIYPWGSEFDVKKAHLSPASDIKMKAAAVGTYAEGASVYGVSDLIGNVWEWTETWYLPYPNSTLRKAEFGMKYRAVRGLSYHSLGHYPGGAYPKVLSVYARASTRSYDPPGERLEDLGFRCVKRNPGS